MSGIHDIPAPKVFHVPQLPPDEDSGKYITDLFAHGGDHTTVLLEQGASYNLYSKILLQGHHQELATEGYPDENHLKARLFTRGKDEAGAIFGRNKRYQAVRNVAIHGCRTDYGWLKGGAALVALGDWDAVEPAVENCVLADPRGWSCCHLVDGAQGARAIGNLIGPAGQPPPHGPWADGLSVACRNGLIANNTIIDATDGAIVLFGAPGTVCINNTIIARTRNLLGGINQVDPALFKGDYTGTRVVGNRIVSEGAFIHLAMGIGSTTWSDAHDMQVYGGKTLSNVIGPGRFGYGIAAAGCRDYTVLQNRIAPNTTFSGSMDVIPHVSPPTAFLRIDDGWAEGTFQPGFVQGPVRYLIGVQEGLGKTIEYHADALDWKEGTVVELRDVRIELSHEGRLVIWDQHRKDQVLWSSPPTAHQVARGTPLKATLDRKTGKFRIETHASPPQILWDPMQSFGNYQTVKGDPVLRLSDTTPYLSIKDGGSTLFTTSGEHRYFDLLADEFIAAVPPESPLSGGSHQTPPPIPHASRPLSLREALSSIHISGQNESPSGVNSKPLQPTNGPVFLWLDPETSQLVLHGSPHPRHVDKDAVIWKSPNWKTPASDPANRSKATLQGDGNLVIYAGKNGAVWASGTNGRTPKVDTVAIVPSGVDGGPARLEIRSGEQVVWANPRKA